MEIGDDLKTAQLEIPRTNYTADNLLDRQFLQLKIINNLRGYILEVAKGTPVDRYSEKPIISCIRTKLDHILLSQVLSHFAEAH